MKRFAYILLAAVLSAVICGCSKDEGPSVDRTILGNWRILTWNGTSSGDFDIYITFGADGSFCLYQRVDSPLYDRFTGTYSASDGILSGVYSDGTPWNTSYGYELSSSGNSLTMTGVSGTETSVYVRSSIPEDVINAAGTRSHISSPAFPIL